MIWKAYKYLFYQNCMWNQSGSGSWGRFAPSWAAVGMSFCFLFYFYAIGFLMSILGFRYIFMISSSQVSTILLAVIILGLHDFLLVRQLRYKKIIEEFSRKEDRQSHRKGQIIFWCYVASSMISFFCAGGLMVWFGNS